MIHDQNYSALITGVSYYLAVLVLLRNIRYINRYDTY